MSEQKEDEIPREYLADVCKIGQAGACCKYLIFGGYFQCAKDDPGNKKVVDDNWARFAHTAQGNNCKGYLTEKKPKIIECVHNDNVDTCPKCEGLLKNYRL